VAGVHSADLVVLGAGPAGLAAAWRAARRGLSVVVLERAAAVGGMAASFEVGGMQVDHGSHRLHPSIAPAVLADLTDLLGDDLQLRPRNGRLRVADRWVGFPLRPGELARTLPRSLLARIGVDALAAPRRHRSGEPASFADALRRGLGPALYDQLYGPYAVKLWGLPGEAIDAEQARRRVTADTPWKIAARMLRRGGGTNGLGRVFRYPRRGFGQLTEAIAGAAVDAGAELRLSTQAEAVLTSTEGVTVRTVGGPEIAARHVFSTVPLPVLARITTPAPAPDAAEGAAHLRFRSMVLIYVVHQGARPWTPFDAHYLPQASTPLTRVSEPANYRDSADDPRDRTVLCCELPCSVGDEHWTASDEQLGALVAEHLGRVGLPPLSVAEVHTRRLPRVYPVYEIGFQRHLQALDDWAAALPRVTTFGRLGLFAHDNTHHALAMAYDAVDALRRGAVFDEGAWTAARRRFAAHVVED